MTYLTKEATVALNRALHLPATGREQDWDIELADPDRVGEFIAYFEAHQLSKNEKYALMALILGSLEDLSNREEISLELWGKVRHLLWVDLSLYTDLLSQWNSKGDDLDDFAISPLLQSL